MIPTTAVLAGLASCSFMPLPWVMTSSWKTLWNVEKSDGVLVGGLKKTLTKSNSPLVRIRMDTV